MHPSGGLAAGTMEAGAVRRRRRSFPAAGWWRCNRGASALEFALLAPILGFALIASVDFGFAISERMALDHVLRTGAQSAMADAGEGQVNGVMQAAAAPNFGLDGTAWSPGSTEATFSAVRYCACASSLATAVPCATVCPGSQPTFTFYRMTGRKTYAGRITPDLSFNRAVQVQVR